MGRSINREMISPTQREPQTISISAHERPSKLSGSEMEREGSSTVPHQVMQKLTQETPLALGFPALSSDFGGARPVAEGERCDMVKLVATVTQDIAIGTQAR